MTAKEYGAWCKQRIARSKNPLGVTSIGLLGKTAKKKFGVGVVTLEGWLTELRKDGTLRYTLGHWWVP